MEQEELSLLSLTFADISIQFPQTYYLFKKKKDIDNSACV